MSTASSVPTISVPNGKLSVLGLPSVCCTIEANHSDEVSPVPVTARLSRKFYDTFGDDIANELVEWFNQVDATYRADLLQINELNFNRFDAKFEQRIAQLDAKWDQKWNQLDAKLEKQIAQLEAKFGQRIAQLEARLDQKLARRFEQMDAKWNERWLDLNGKIDHGWAELNAKIDRRAAETKAELMKWMFVFWAGTLVPLGALILLLR